MDAMRYPLKIIGSLSVQSITKAHLEKIKEDMLDMPVKPVSVRCRLSVLRTVLRWCAQKIGVVLLISQNSPRHTMKIHPSYTRRIGIDNAMGLASYRTRNYIGRSMWCPCRAIRDVTPYLGWCRPWTAYTPNSWGSKNLNAPWREVPIRESLIPFLRHGELRTHIIMCAILLHIGGNR